MSTLTLDERAKVSSLTLYVTRRRRRAQAVTAALGAALEQSLAALSLAEAVVCIALDETA